MSALSTEQLNSMLKDTVTNTARCVVLGVFPGDMVPMKLTDGRLLCSNAGAAQQSQCTDNTHYCFVLNSHAHVDPGEHWIAFFYNSNTNTLEYFDSFGLPLTAFAVVYAAIDAHNLAAMCKAANTVGVLQSTESAVCGQYCVAFLHWRAKHTHAPISQFANIMANMDTAARRDKYIVSHVRALTNRSACSSHAGACSTSSSCACSQSCVCRVLALRR